MQKDALVKAYSVRKIISATTGVENLLQKTRSDDGVVDERNKQLSHLGRRKFKLI